MLRRLRHWDLVGICLEVSAVEASHCVVVWWVEYAFDSRLVLLRLVSIWVVTKRKVLTSLGYFFEKSIAIFVPFDLQFRPCSSCQCHDSQHEDNVESKWYSGYHFRRCFATWWHGVFWKDWGWVLTIEQSSNFFFGWGTLSVFWHGCVLWLLLRALENGKSGKP